MVFLKGRMVSKSKHSNSVLKLQPDHLVLFGQNPHQTVYLVTISKLNNPLLNPRSQVYYCGIQKSAIEALFLRELEYEPGKALAKRLFPMISSYNKDWERSYIYFSHGDFRIIELRLSNLHLQTLGKLSSGK